jgi:hypothetical protein
MITSSKAHRLRLLPDCKLTLSPSLTRCEENYTYSPYIAEFVNTLSNIPFICLGLYGYYRVLQQGLPRRYGYLMLGLSIIGGGSGLFHMTVSCEGPDLDRRRRVQLNASLCSSSATMVLAVDGRVAHGKSRERCQKRMQRRIRNADPVDHAFRSTSSRIAVC